MKIVFKQGIRLFLLTQSNVALLMDVFLLKNNQHPSLQMSFMLINVVMGSVKKLPVLLKAVPSQKHQLPVLRIAPGDSHLRILSLVPAVTEMVYTLGLGKYLVGVDAESDYPIEVHQIPKVTSAWPQLLSSQAIDRRVQASLHHGRSVLHLDQKLLKKLQPNLILSQELCAVCALPFQYVKQAVRVLEDKVTVISFEPKTLNDIFVNLLTLGKYTQTIFRAKQVRSGLLRKLQRIKKVLKDNKVIFPRVLVVEWLDPVMIAGHWVPDMVKLAGGKNLLAKSAQPARKISINELKEISPDIILIAPCGFNLKRTLREQNLIKKISNQFNSRTVLVDANAYFTRPGPRIVEGIEILTEIFHPHLFPPRHYLKCWLEFS